MNEIDNELIEPFLDSIKNVLCTMAQIDPTQRPGRIKRDTKSKGDVTGMIGLTGKELRGSIAISFSTASILSIATKMLGEQIDELDESVADLVGEITNMVSGGAKKILSDKGYKFEMAIPTTVIGVGHMIKHQSLGPVVLVPFDMEAGRFFIEICFEHCKGEA